jgi:antitoxin (DNA-binding transcriptional repressor) of toxin-antitoxin stability system
LSRHLARVRRGGEITVYDRGTPIARIVPFAPATRAAGKAADPSRARLADLVREGVVSPHDPQALADWLEGHPPVELPAGNPSALDVLLEQRRESKR